MNRKPYHRVIRLCLLLSLIPAMALGQDRVMTIEGGRIQGDPESPTVMYVVPWQAPDSPILPSPGGSFMVPDQHHPVERSAFLRLMRYHRQFIEARRHGCQDCGPQTLR